MPIWGAPHSQTNPNTTLKPLVKRVEAIHFWGPVMGNVSYWGHGMKVCLSMFFYLPVS